MNDWTEINLNDLNKSQQRGARKIINQAEESAARLERYSPVVVVKIQRFQHLVSIQAVVTLPELGAGNLLRYLTESDNWHAFIGRRGAVSAVNYPKSCDQFKNKRAFGINFK